MGSPETIKGPPCAGQNPDGSNGLKIEQLGPFARLEIIANIHLEQARKDMQALNR
jgi:hypothetical protein